jgi:hypothetical protein
MISIVQLKVYAVRKQRQQKNHLLNSKRHQRIKKQAHQSGESAIVCRIVNTVD